MDFQFVSFPSADGASLNAPLVQGLDGAFYGTAYSGGPNSFGAVFRVTTPGAITPLYGFCAKTSPSGVCVDGNSPSAGLVLATDGNFYGTTTVGGSATYPSGTIFQITPAGVLKTIWRFCPQGPPCSNGAIPYNGVLIQATDGNLYGTTTNGGVPSGAGAGGVGTVFKVTPGGTLTTLYRFCASGACTDGAFPWAGLVQTTSGNFYGTTFSGGTYGFGTVFRITAAGALTTLHSFNVTNGDAPIGSLIQGADGELYGTTSVGGANGGGTVFKMTPLGSLTTIYDFCALANCSDGGSPYGPLVQATDGNFYGTTYGGANGWGTIFQLTPAGTLRTLHSFNLTDGGLPLGGLVQGTDGRFYGTTAAGGIGGGTAFSVSVGLGPFVKTIPTSGKVGSTIRLLGTNLTGTTSVMFGAKAATFTVVSPTQIVATVPANAVTGKVHVTTPSGTLTSNVVFRVMPVISNFSPPSGSVGTPVTISGETLTGATSVTFGGVSATTFTVNSNTQITATLPTGAVTGRISVTTPGGRATSAGTFTVN